MSGRFFGPGVCALDDLAGRVGEWLKPADCKSAAPCGLRRFESSPVHQRLRQPAGLVLSGSSGSRVRVKEPALTSHGCRADADLLGTLRRLGESLLRFQTEGLVVVLRSPMRILRRRPVRAWVAQLVERVLGKDEVTGSIPVPGSSLPCVPIRTGRAPGEATTKVRDARVRAGNERG